MSLRIAKDDIVKVRSGRSRDKVGRVLKVMPDKGKALVEGVNMVHCHERKRKQGQPSGIVSKESPLPLSCLMLVDGKDAGRVRATVRPDGTKVRVHAKTGKEMPTQKDKQRGSYSKKSATK